jgi:chemotaxis protein methyltransferase CheR
LISEALGLRSIQDKVAILGTDISQPMIEQAEHGVYDQYRLEQVPPPFLKRYFEPVGLGQWRVVPWLRQMCTFRRMNLQSPQWPFRYPFHVILCRNVLYYFDGPHQEQLLTSLYEAAAPGAWLLTSVTETLHSLNTPWEKIGPGVFRKKR